VYSVCIFKYHVKLNQNKTFEMSLYI